MWSIASKPGSFFIRRRTWFRIFRACALNGEVECAEFQYEPSSIEGVEVK